MWPRIGSIPTYGIFYLTGIILHFFIARWLAHRWGLKRRVWIAVGLCYLLGMTLGAKILFDLRHGELDFAALLTRERWTRGGLWGGMLAYVGLAVPLVLLLAGKRRAGLDLIAVSLPIPWIMAKTGCLFNGCCYGRPCSLPWAITFGPDARGAPAGIPLHPTQVYEMILMLILVGLFAALRHERWRGTKLLWFLLVYGFGRAAIDLLRGDTDPGVVGPLTPTQLVCLIAAASALAVLLVIGRRNPGATLSD